VAAIFLEQVALLEGLVDRRFVVWTRLFQHVVKYPRASRGRSRTPSSWVNGKGVISVVIAPLLVCLAARLLPLLAPLVLLLGLLGLAALCGRVIHALALLPIEDRPHRLLAIGEAGGDVDQLVRVDQRVAPKLAHKIPTGRALEEGVHDLGLGHTQELCAALGEAPYEVPKRLVGLLGARAQIPGVSRVHVRALEVPHEGANQIVPVVYLASLQMLKPRPRRVSEVQRQVADDDLVGGGSAQLTCQTVVVEPYAGVCFPRVFVDRRGLAEALREARHADLPAEHTGSRGLRRRRAVLSAVIAPTRRGW
jgi:hypothetical protein